MSWFSGAGLGAIFKRILSNPTFQSAFKTGVQNVGQLVLDNLSDPAKLEKIGKNLVNNPDVMVGAVVKGTEAEKLVDPTVVAAADAELAKPH